MKKVPPASARRLRSAALDLERPNTTREMACPSTILNNLFALKDHE
jgi:hypothetical protein